jgi:sporulation protein YlmC with PRC-barrel domain
MLPHVWELSRVIGRDVLGPDQQPVGRLADLTVRLDSDDGPSRVQRLLVTCRGAMALLPWGEVQALRTGQLVLRTGDLGEFRIGSRAEALHPAEILLRRDLLDTQIVDVAGQRLARVGDVLLTRTAGAELDVTGIEVGFSAVLRRLGLTRLAGSGRTDIVSFADVHLTSERGHAVALSTPRAAVHRLGPRELAVLVSRVDTDSATEILSVQEPAVAAEALGAADPEVSERVLRAMPRLLAARIVAAMPAGSARRWRQRLAGAPELGRRFLRSRVWSRRHLNWHPNGERR